MGDSDDGDGGESGGVSLEGWRPMASAPRDRSLLIVRLAPGRRVKHHEHIVRWDDSGPRGIWRSSTVKGAFLPEERCVGWRPLDDAAREYLERQRERYRPPGPRKRRGAKGKRPASG